MAIHKYYVGSLGPYLYDDNDPVNDPDGDFTGEKFKSFLSTGQLKIQAPPTGEGELVRYQDILGGGFYPVVSKIADYSPLISDYYILCDCTAGDITINMPDSVGHVGNEWVITKIDSSVNKVIIDPFGSELINGFSTMKILFKNSSAHIFADGTGLRLK